VPPFNLGERTNDPLQMYLADIYTVTGSLAGVPGISVPCGKICGKLPVGLQIFGPAFGEARVLQLAHQPNITVQVLKERVTHPGLDGPFSVAEVPGVGVVAYLEDAHDGQTIDDQGVANLLRVRWDTIRTEALSGTATLDLLEQTLATLEERCQD
jgi:hypothetical protein